MIAETKLYWAKGTCSLASMAALIISGVPFEAEEALWLNTGLDLPDRFESRRVPVLEHDGSSLTETLAILFWANEHRRGEPLLPQDDALPGAVSRLAWLASRVHPTRRQFARPAQFDSDPDVHCSLKASALPKYRNDINELERGVRAGEYNSPALGCYALVFYHWARLDGLLGPEHGAIQRLAEHLMDNPGVRDATLAHGFDVGITSG